MWGPPALGPGPCGHKLSPTRQSRAEALSLRCHGTRWVDGNAGRLECVRSPAAPVHVCAFFRAHRAPASPRAALAKTIRVYMERDPIILFSCTIGLFGARARARERKDEAVLSLWAGTPPHRHPWIFAPPERIRVVAPQAFWLPWSLAMAVAPRRRRRRATRTGSNTSTRRRSRHDSESIVEWPTQLGPSRCTHYRMGAGDWCHPRASWSCTRPARHV